jgi:hypothetical protein
VGTGIVRPSMNSGLTGNDAPLALKPEAGTLEVTRDGVMILYTQDGVDYRTIG